MEGYVSWWLNTLPPVSGELRVIFLVGLLVLCLIDKPSPLWAAETISGCHRTFYSPPRLLRFFGIRWVTPGVLRVVSVVTVCCWGLSILGLAQPGFGILTFLGFGFLHAVASGALGSNHSTHSALFALFCLQFSVSYQWSLDGLISAWTGAPTPVPDDSPLHSGFAPTLLLILLAFTMFAGGVAKLRYGWRGWLNGSALHFYIAASAPAARWPWASRLLIARPKLCLLGGYLALAIELGAVLAIFSEPLRPWLILSWVLLHLGILLVMMPAYWVQAWCYLLLLDWPVLLGGSRPSFVSGVGDPWPVVFAALGTAVALALLWVIVFEVEQWPFTNVPMYSNGTPAADRISLPEPDSLNRHARSMMRGRQGQWPRAWADVESVQDLWLVPEGGGSPVRFWHTLAEAGAAPVRWSQYAKVIRELTCQQVAAGSGPSSTEPFVAAFLGRAGALAAEAPQAGRFSELRLIVQTTDGERTVARQQLVPDQAVN